MDGDDPELEAFKFNLRWILRARASGKTAALVSNICRMHLILNRPAYRAKKMLNPNPTAAHHLIASLIRTIYQMITKHPQNDSSKGISTLLLAACPGGPQGKLMKRQFGQRWNNRGRAVFTNHSCSCAPHGNFLLLPNPTGNCWNCRS